MGWPADVPASAHVFVATAADLADTLDVAGEDGHHLTRVLRLRAGETVTVADGSGGWRPYRVGRGHPGPAGASVAVEDAPASGRGPGPEVHLEAEGELQREPELCPRLAVAFALTKGDKPELVVQKLTELGVDRILPVLSDRSIARPNVHKTAALGERWRKIAREAARQCRRATIPAVDDLAPLAKLAGHPGLVVAERGGRSADALSSPSGGEVLVVVGPEGGFAKEEVEALTPWRRLGLGPHVLRAETAALAAATLVGTQRRPKP